VTERRTKDTYSGSRGLLGDSRWLWGRLSGGGLGDGLDSLDFLGGSSNGSVCGHYKRGFERELEEKGSERRVEWKRRVRQTLRDYSMTRERGACCAALGPLGAEKEEREEEIRFRTNSAPLLSVFGSAYAPNKNTCPNLFDLNSFPFGALAGHTPSTLRLRCNILEERCSQQNTTCSLCAVVEGDERYAVGGVTFVDETSQIWGRFFKCHIKNSCMFGGSCIQLHR